MFEDVTKHKQNTAAGKSLEVNIYKYSRNLNSESQLTDLLVWVFCSRCISISSSSVNFKTFLYQ